MMDKDRIIAHTTVLSSAISPCRKYIVFGTNVHNLLLYSLDFVSERSLVEAKPLKVLHLDNCRSIYSLCSSSNMLFCGSIGVVLVYEWVPESETILKYRDSVRSSCERRFMEEAEVTDMLFSEKSQTLLTSSGFGDIHLYSLVGGISLKHSFNAHTSTIYKMCSAGAGQFVTCSEDGSVCFWDERIIESGNNVSSSSGSFKPGSVKQLARPKLGVWLKTVCCDPMDPNWFVTGGGPRLALWNRRANRFVCTLDPDNTINTWYAQTSAFLGVNEDPRIVAGGNSGNLHMWDHMGHLLSSTNLRDPPNARIDHVLVTNLIEFKTNNKLTNAQVDATDAILVVGGCGPALRLVSKLGYPCGTLRLSS